jgi:hypothetical protein
LKREVERREILDERDVDRLQALPAEEPAPATSMMFHTRAREYQRPCRGASRFWSRAQRRHVFVGRSKSPRKPLSAATDAALYGSRKTCSRIASSPP